MVVVFLCTICLVYSMTHPPWRPWYGVVSGPGNCLFFNVVSLVLSGLMAPKRRSTIEVHPSFSEAPHLWSSVPRPKTGFSKNQNASRRIIPWPKSTKRFFFSKSRSTYRRFGLKKPRLSETNSGNVLPLSYNWSKEKPYSSKYCLYGRGVCRMWATPFL